METYFAELTNVMVAITLTALMVVIFMAIMGAIAVLTIKTAKFLYIHVDLAAREPRDKIIKKFRGRIVRMTDKKKEATG